MPEGVGRIRVEVPLFVASQAKRLKDQGQIVSLDLPALAAEEAPIAARMRDDQGRVVEYRLYDGALWQKAGGPGNRMNLSSLGNLVSAARGERMEGLFLSRVSEVARAVRKTFQKPTTGPIGEFGPRTKLHEGELGSVPGMEMLIEEAKDADRHGIVVDEELWRRSDGPILQGSLPGHMYHLFGQLQTESITTNPEHRCLRFRACDFDIAERQMAEVYGRDRIGFRGDRGEWLEEIPASDAFDREAVEMALWHFLWLAGWQKEWQTKDGRMAAAVVTTREALTARWGGMDLPMEHRNHETLARHLFRRDIPAPEDLLPVLKDVVTAVEGRIDPLLAKAWRLCHLRGEELQNRLDQKIAVDDLSGFKI